MTNEQIIDLYEGLSEISQNKDLNFKAVVSFIFAKNKNLLKPFYNAAIEARQQLIEKYGQINEDNWFIPKDNVQYFKTEYDTLMSVNTYIDLEKIPIDILEEERININLMEKLLPIIKQ